MKRTLNYMALALVLAGSPAAMAEGTDCYDLSVAVTKAVAAKPDHVLQIVSREVSANSDCACEVVKAAIVATEADRKLVAQIVETAIEAAPEKMRMVAQCAIAVAPDALPNVQAILVKHDPQGGDTVIESAKGGLDKGAKIPIPEQVSPASPLDGPYLVPGEPPIHPGFRTPPSISDPGSLPGARFSSGSGSSPYGSDNT